MCFLVVRRWKPRGMEGFRRILWSIERRFWSICTNWKSANVIIDEQRDRHHSSRNYLEEKVENKEKGGKIKWFVVLIEKKFDPRANGQQTDVILWWIFDQGKVWASLTASQRIFALVGAQGIKDQQSFENHHRHSKHDRWRVDMSARRDERIWLNKMLSRVPRAASTSANANSWDERRSNIYTIDHHEINKEKRSGKWIRWPSHAEQRVCHDLTKEEAETSSSTAICFQRGLLN